MERLLTAMALRILVAPDKFKGSLTAEAAAQAMAEGIRAVLPVAEVVLRPIADGGEGTAEILHAALGGEWVMLSGIADPLGRPVTARYLRLNAEVAVIAMSEASGLWRLQPAEYDPLHASTLGTGQLVADALRRGARRLLIGLGGSATHDGGVGLAQALGYTFLDADGRPLSPEPANFGRLARIQAPPVFPAAEIIGLCDVANPLAGPHGAAHTYGPQKGANATMLEELDLALVHLADCVARDLHVEHRDTPGAGAAGGLGFGLLGFGRARLQPGFATLAELLQLEREIAACDLVLTGEGALDAQTLHGKGPWGVAQLARRQGKPVLAFAGRVASDAGLATAFARCHAITPPGMPFADACAAAPALLQHGTAHVLADWVGVRHGNRATTSPAA